MLEKMKWNCSCGYKDNVGEFCERCGKKRIALWNCSCGQGGNRGVYCSNCGRTKEEKEMDAHTENKIQEHRKEGTPASEKRNQWKIASIVSVAICIGITAVFALLYYADEKTPFQKSAQIKKMQAKEDEKPEQKKTPQTEESSPVSSPTQTVSPSPTPKSVSNTVTKYDQYKTRLEFKLAAISLPDGGAYKIVDVDQDEIPEMYIQRAYASSSDAQWDVYYFHNDQLEQTTVYGEITGYGNSVIRTAAATGEYRVMGGRCMRDYYQEVVDGCPQNVVAGINYENETSYYIGDEPVTPDDFYRYLKEQGWDELCPFDPEYLEEDEEEDYDSMYDYDTEDYEEDYIIPESSERKLTKSDVKGLSKQEIRYACNEIYARNGRKFKDQELQDYFDEQYWYEGYIEPDEFDESLLSDVERYNAYFLRELCQ